MFPFPAGTDPEKFCTKERFPSMRQYHLDAKNNFLWVDSIVGGTIPNNFLPAVEKGFKERLERGVIAATRFRTSASKCTSASITTSIARKPPSRRPARWPSATLFQRRSHHSWSRSSTCTYVPNEKLGDITSDLSPAAECRQYRRRDLQTSPPSSVG